MRESTVATTSPMADRLVMRWTSVTDVEGRTGLEARWVPAEQPVPVAHHAA